MGEHDAAPKHGPLEDQPQELEEHRIARYEEQRRLSNLRVKQSEDEHVINDLYEQQLAAGKSEKEARRAVEEEKRRQEQEANVQDRPT